MLGRIVALLGKAGSTVGAIAIAGMMVITCSEVLSRALLRQSITWSIDVVGFCVGAVALLGMAYVQAQKRHIRVDLLVSHLPRRWQSIVVIFGNIAALLLFSVLAWRGWEHALNRLGATTSSLAELPLFPSALLVPIGAFMISLQLIVDLWREIKAYKAA